MDTVRDRTPQRAESHSAASGTSSCLPPSSVSLRLPGLGTLVVALALALSPQTAQAHIVQFVTAVPMTVVDGVPDETAVSNMILTAVKDALRQAVAFMPTLVVVEDARVVDGHLYLLVLAADSEGETLMQELENAASRHPAGPLEHLTGPQDPHAKRRPGREVIQGPQVRQLAGEAQPL